MNQYARLTLFLIVLTLSVGMLSTAINILGNIDRLDLDEDRTVSTVQQRNPNPLTKSSEETEVGGGSPKNLGPLFLIQFPPRTRYLRRNVAENYTGKSWMSPADAENIEYNGETLEMDSSYPNPFDRVEFYVEPLSKMRRFVPVAPNTYLVDFNTSLLYYPDYMTFESPEDYMEPYWVSYNLYSLSDAALRSSNPVGDGMMLQIPEELRSMFANLASSITEGYNNPYDKLRAIESYLYENYRFDRDYTNAPQHIDPVRWFLFNDRKGIATHFNSAFILLARSIGIPARAVTGYRVEPDVDYQYVMPQQVYFYAEVEFRDLGWVIFDATPKDYMEGEADVNKTITKTNITGNDPIGLRGKTFNVWGTVTDENGTDISGPQVEIILMVDKEDENETGVICGAGVVTDGWFNVTCDVAIEQELGDYDLIAHTLSNVEFKESWSDPPIVIMTETEVTVKGPKRIYAEHNITFSGYVVDVATEEPVPNMTLRVEYLGEEIEATSDERGKIQYVVNFPEKGENNMTLIADDVNYYVGSNTTFGVSVILPPPSPNNIIAFLFGFPNNIIMAVTGATGLGVYLARRSKKREAIEETPVQVRRAREQVAYEDNVPLTYATYEEGVVKIFNRFYVSMQRLYPEIEDTMTPREFEATLVARISSNAHAALNDLITSYEIAMYSNQSLTVEDFTRTTGTVELIIELMKNGR